MASPPADLRDRRVEITGPVDRKMIINALNSGANVFMADFEDATAPTFENLVNGQQNLIQAVRRNLNFTAKRGATMPSRTTQQSSWFVRGGSTCQRPISA